MTSTSSVGVLGTQGQQNTSGTDAFADVDLDDFLKLLIAELSNQDPMEPMDNNQILQQVSQIQEIESNKRLSTTLESVVMGQNVATAANLLGTTIAALSDQAEWITGMVDRVSLEDGVTKVHIGDQTIDLKNVAEIVPEGSTFTVTDTTETQ